VTLDPTDWELFRTTGHQMVDDMLESQRTVRDRAPWRPVPPETKARLDEPIPFAGMPLDDVYAQFTRDILPYPIGNAHPRFWGWVKGNGTPTGMLAEMLAAGMNPNMGGFDQSAAVVERKVIAWLAELMGFPVSASGILVSGGSVANLNGLLAARAAKAGWDVREEGLHGGPPLVVYGSTETHSCVRKACDTMGLGRQGFRAIKVDKAYRMDIAACRAAIDADIVAGKRPIAIVANVGTVSTGAVDDLGGLRALADEYGLWLHVDGAFGAMAALSSSRHLVAGQEMADSIAFDLHKWGYMPYDVGVILTRDDAALMNTFQAPAGSIAYLSAQTRGPSVGATFFADRGLELSRGFRALKVWMSMKEQGVDRIGAAIQKNIEQAHYLGALVERTPALELLAPVSMNIVCFRYRAGVPEDQLDPFNRELLAEIQLRGIAVPSHTLIDGKFAIRVCVANHRSETEDFDALVEGATVIGAELTANFQNTFADGFAAESTSAASLMESAFRGS
jgi:aromatic-L-amino-acid/L-tryptophan decarboxylase